MLKILPRGTLLFTLLGLGNLETLEVASLGMLGYVPICRCRLLINEFIGFYGFMMYNYAFHQERNRLQFSILVDGIRTLIVGLL